MRYFQSLLAAITLTMIVYGQANAQAPTKEATRLQRIAVHDADGKIYADTTMGNLTVEQFEYVYRKYIAGKNTDNINSELAKTLCGPGTGEIAAIATKKVLKAKSKVQKAALRSGDQVEIRNLAIETIAWLADVSTKAIVDDEAISPGAYSDSIGGMTFAIRQCNFFGHLK